MAFLNWQIYAIGSAFFAGLTAIFGKLGVENLNSNLATLIRTVVIFFVTTLVVSFRSEWTWPNDGLEVKPVLFLVLSGIATGFSWLLYYRALQLAPASLVAPVDKLSVVFAIVLALVFLGEPLTFRLIVGGLLVFAGVCVLSWPA